VNLLDEVIRGHKLIDGDTPPKGQIAWSDTSGRKGMAMRARQPFARRAQKNQYKTEIWIPSLRAPVRFFFCSCPQTSFCLDAV
jgi:hypothetical protein